MFVAHAWVYAHKLVYCKTYTFHACMRTCAHSTQAACVYTRRRHGHGKNSTHAHCRPAASRAFSSQSRCLLSSKRPQPSPRTGTTARFSRGDASTETTKVGHTGTKSLRVTTKVTENRCAAATAVRPTEPAWCPTASVSPTMWMPISLRMR